MKFVTKYRYIKIVVTSSSTNTNVIWFHIRFALALVEPNFFPKPATIQVDRKYFKLSIIRTRLDPLQWIQQTLKLATLKAPIKYLSK